MANHDMFIEAAIELSATAAREMKGGPFGAVLVKDGQIVARGVNEVIISNDPTAHAEIVAIRRAASKLNTFNLSALTLYSSCEPCPMCLSAALWARISTIFYSASRVDAAAIGFDDALIYEELSKPVSRRSFACVQIPHADATEAMRVWARTKNKIVY